MLWYFKGQTSNDLPSSSWMSLKVGRCVMLWRLGLRALYVRKWWPMIFCSVFFTLSSVIREGNYKWWDDISNRLKHLYRFLIITCIENNFVLVIKILLTINLLTLAWWWMRNSFNVLAPVVYNSIHIYKYLLQIG